jgi:hypothetical protein
MQDSGQVSQRREMSFLEVVAILAESWKIIVIVPILTAVVAALVVSILPHQYETTAVVELGIDGKPEIGSEAFLSVIAKKAGFLEEFGEDRSAARKQLLQGYRVASLGQGQMEISYRDTSAEQSKLVVDTVLSEFSDFLSRRVDKTPAELRKIENLKYTVGVLEQTVKEVQERFRYDFTLPREQAAYESLVRTLVAVVSDLESRRDYLATLETREMGGGIIQASSTPRKVDENSAVRLAGLWATISLLAALGFVLLRAAVENARKDPQSNKSLQRIAAAFQFVRRTR